MAERTWFRLSRGRVHGALAILRARDQRLRRVLAARVEAGADERELAALRGKAAGYREAVHILEQLDHDRALPKRWREDRNGGAS